MSRRLFLAAALVAAASLSRALAGEDARVMVDALVFDEHGNPVPGLDGGDFEIIAGDWVQPVSGARMLTADAAPRRFVFVFNRRGAAAAQLRRMKNGLEKFVSERFGDRDEALFVDFAEVPRITRGWRTGRTEALPEVRNVTPIGFRSPLGRAEDAADAAFMLFALAERLADIPGRKLVVLFSHSFSAFVGEAGGNVLANDPPAWTPASPRQSRDGTDRSLEPLARAFNAANAAIYPIHLEGTRRQEDGILVRSREESSASLSARRARRMNAFTRPSDDFLSSLASETGGSYTAQATDFARILEDIEQANRLWYELSFAPFGANIPGRYQPHEIRVRNRPGLKVVVRPGHVVPY